MKILIAVDMEGITGVVHVDHTTPGHAEYERFRRLMTEDVNAAIRGAFDGSATEVVVSDGHWDNRNILIEELDSRARLNAGGPRPFSMVEGIDSGVDGVLFVGYHARVGTPNAILDHTWSTTRVAGLWLNDTLIGEIGLNAAVCGHFRVPVLMVSGDQSACAEASALLGPLELVIVKNAVGRTAAECLPPAVTKDKIRKAAKRASQEAGRGPGPGPLPPGSADHGGSGIHPLGDGGRGQPAARQPARRGQAGRVHRGRHADRVPRVPVAGGAGERVRVQRQAARDKITEVVLRGGLMCTA